MASLEERQLTTSIRVTDANGSDLHRSFKNYQQKLDAVVKNNRLKNQPKPEVAIVRTMPPLPKTDYWHKPQPQIIRAKAHVQYTKSVQTSTQATLTTTKTTMTLVNVNLLQQLSATTFLGDVYDENTITRDVAKLICRDYDNTFNYPGALAKELWRRVSCYDGPQRYFDQISRDALRQLILFRHQFTSGLNPDKLHELGFFVVDKGKKILCYDSRIVQPAKENPLRINFINTEAYDSRTTFESLPLNTQSLGLTQENSYLRHS